MHRYIIILLTVTISLAPLYIFSQPKSLRFSATAGINRYAGLTGEYNHPSTEYKLGKAITTEFSYVSGTKYLPGQYAVGLIIDYYTGSFREYGEGLNGIEYLNGEVSKLMIGGSLIPIIIEFDEQFYSKHPIKPILWMV